MNVIELKDTEFEKFASNNPLRNYMQTKEYAKAMKNNGYTYEFIGFNDDNNKLVAASLILKKKIGFSKYIYAPKGILIDYNNSELVRLFFKEIRKYYKKKKYAFIKINPEIIIGKYTNKYLVDYNKNVNIIDTLKDLGCNRRKELYYLDFVCPRINPIINLKEFDYEDLDKETANNIVSINESGFSLETLDKKDIHQLYNMMKDEVYNSQEYYKSILNAFDESELLMVKVDYEQCLIKAKERYENEMQNNNYWNELIQSDNSEENINNKMASDIRLLKFKNDVIEATEGLKLHKYAYACGCIIVPYKNRVNLIATGFNNSNNITVVEDYLYAVLIQRYKDKYEFLDLNGLISNMDNDFNRVKLSFKPDVYEFIGEFDYPLNDAAFKRIQNKKLLSKEFMPSHKIKTDI